MSAPIFYKTIIAEELVARNAQFTGNVRMEDINLNVGSLHHARKLRVRDLKSRSSRSDDMIVYGKANVRGNLSARYLEVSDNLVVRGDLNVVGNMVRNQFIDVVDTTTDTVNTRQLTVSADSELKGDVLCGGVLTAKALVSESAVTANDLVANNTVHAEEANIRGNLACHQTLTANALHGDSLTVGTVRCDSVLASSVETPSLLVRGLATIEGDLVVPNGYIRQNSMRLTSFLDVGTGNVTAGDAMVNRNLNVQLKTTTKELMCRSHATVGGDLRVSGRLFASDRAFDKLTVEEFSGTRVFAGEITCSSLNVLGSTSVTGGSGSVDLSGIEANVVANINIPGIVANIVSEVSASIPDLSEQVLLLDVTSGGFLQQPINGSVTPYEFVAPFDMVLTVPPKSSVKRIPELGSASEVRVFMYNQGASVFADQGFMLIPAGFSNVLSVATAPLSPETSFIREGNTVSITYSADVSDSRNLQTYVLYRRQI
jgi:hypothetical protein